MNHPDTPTTPDAPNDKAPDRVPFTPPVLRPVPGPAAVRPIWDGEEDVDPASLTPPPDPEPGPTPARWTKAAAFGPAGNSRRILGLDAARGYALVGMIAVHTLPAYNATTDEPTLVWRLFAGHAAGLFAVLAGVSIALITGANNPHTGRRLRRDRFSLVTRALLILAVGLALDEFGLPVYNILPYYGLMFLLAVTLTRLRIRWLLVAAALIIAVGPVVIVLVNRWGGYTTTLNPDFSSLTSMPVDTLLTLLVGGTYPAVTWMAYLCLGMAIGRLNLRWLMTQVRLATAGAVTAAAGFLTSTFLVDYGGGFDRLYELTAGYDSDDIQEIIDYGPYEHLPTDTWWWMSIAGPHTNTPLSVIATAGLALLAIGAFLIIARVVNDLLVPLIAAGSMTLTLYVSHMLFLLALGDRAGDEPSLWFVVQVIAALVFATAWQIARGRGPLEEIVAQVCRAISRAFVPDHGGHGAHRNGGQSA